MKPKEKQVNPRAPQDDHKKEVDLSGLNVEFMPAEKPTRRIICSTKTMRAAPNILDIARRGGLSATITPYDLAEVEGKFYVTASGNSTATVNRCFTLGLEKTIDDARELENQLGRAVSAGEAQALIKNLGWLEQNWIEGNVTNSDRNAGEVAKEVASALFTEIGAVGRWTEDCGGVPEDTGSVVQANLFAKSGSGWTIRYGGKEKAFNDSVGLKIIQLALRNPCVSIYSSEVERLVGIGSSASTLSEEERLQTIEKPTVQKIASFDDFREYLRKIDEYNRSIEKAEALGNVADAAFMEKERDELREFLSKMSKPGLSGAVPKTLATDESRSSKRVQTNTSRAIETIAKHIPALGLHLRQYLKASGQVVYLDGSTPWRFN